MKLTRPKPTLGPFRKDRLLTPHELLRRLEWRGTARYWQNNFPKPDDGVRVAACPECGGVKPGVLSNRVFPASALGHASNCQLAYLIGRRSRDED